MSYFGHADLVGKVIGTLRVEQIKRRFPALAYSVVCTLCNTKGVETHKRFQDGSAKCQSSICGKQSLKPSSARASVDPIASPTRSSDSGSLKAFLKEEAERERAEQSQEAANALSGHDPDFRMPDSAKNLRMSVANAKKFVRVESDKFLQKYGDTYYACQENFDALVDYLARNGVQIPNFELFEQAFLKLRRLGLLKERPAEVPQKQPPQGNQPQMHEGIDPKTGLPRTYTQREVDAMDSDTYRRAFKLYGDNRPAFSAVMNRR